MQSRPDPLANSRLVKTFLTNLGVTGISCSFTLVIEGKEGKEIPTSFRLEKFSSKGFALSDAEYNTQGLK